MKLVTQRSQPKEYLDLDSGHSYFSGSQIRKAMHDSYAGIPDHKLEAARIRGNALHLRFALALGAKGGLCTYPEVHPQYPDHCRHMDDWIQSTTFDPLKIEEPSINEKWGYASTPENLLKTPKGLWIIDLKTGGETKTDAVQLTLNHMLAGYENATHLADLYLDEHGYKLIERPYNPFDFACAMAALQLLKWRLTI